MSCDIRHPTAIAWTHAAVVVLALSGLGLAFCDSARSQTPSAPAPSVEPPPASVAPRAENPGLINEIGKLLERRQPLFPALAPAQPSQPSPEPSPAAVDSARSGGEPAPSDKQNSVGIPRLDLKIPSIRTGREKCPVAADGASDCKAAADALCRAHGYKEGRSTDTDATQKCSAEALLLSGRKSQPGACHTDYFVTRAWCQ